jgi:hypothetical protein
MKPTQFFSIFMFFGPFALITLPRLNATVLQFANYVYSCLAITRPQIPFLIKCRNRPQMKLTHFLSIFMFFGLLALINLPRFNATVSQLANYVYSYLAITWPQIPLLTICIRTLKPKAYLQHKNLCHQDFYQINRSMMSKKFFWCLYFGLAINATIYSLKNLFCNLNTLTTVTLTRNRHLRYRLHCYLPRNQMNVRTRPENLATLHCVTFTVKSLIYIGTTSSIPTLDFVPLMENLLIHAAYVQAKKALTFITSNLGSTPQGTCVNRYIHTRRFLKANSRHMSRNRVKHCSYAYLTTTRNLPSYKPTRIRLTRYAEQ